MEECTCSYMNRQLIASQGFGRPHIPWKGFFLNLLATIAIMFPLLGRAQLSLSYTEDIPPFCGIPDAAITLTATGGLPPYQYAFAGSPFGGASTFIGLGPGSFLAQVVDANLDTATVLVNLSDVDGPSVTILSDVSPTCAGGQNGSITATGSGGTGSYTYSLDGVTFQPSGVFSGLGAGNYPVHVRDSLGCLAVQSVTLVAPPAVQLSLVGKTNVDCFGNNTGFFTVAATGGNSGGFQYALDGGNLQTSGTFAGLVADSYTVSVIDAGGCVDTLDILIEEPPLLTLDTDTIVPIACAGDSTGEVELAANGGVGPYLFSFGNFPLQTDSLFQSVPGGKQFAQIQDANGCLVADSILIPSPTPISLSLQNIQEPICAGDSNGTATYLVTGGVTPYSHDWSHGQNNGLSASQLPAGEVVYTVTDSNGCVVVDTLLIPQPATLSATQLVVNPPCSDGIGGSAAITATGGVGPYQYNWSHDATLDTSFVANLNAGIYTVVITDANSCQLEDTLVLIAPPALNLSATVREDTCLVGSGEIALTGSGGTGSLSYFWVQAPTVLDSLLEGLFPGSYTGIVVDGNGCSDSLEVALGGIAGPVLQLDSLLMVRCAGEANGYLGFSVMGGTSPYSYSWADGPAGISVRGGLNAGAYELIVHDAFCADTASATITQPDSLILQLDSLANPRCGDLGGFLRYEAMGGTPPLAATWSHQPGLDTLTLSDLGAGFYQLQLMDANGCQALDSVTLAEPDSIDISLRATDLLCANDSSGEVNVLVEGGTAPYQFDWSLGDTLPAISNLSAGWYKLTVTDQQGCVSQDSVEVQEPSPVTLSGEVVDALCYDSGDGSISIQAKGGTGDLSYEWSDGEALPQREGLFAGTYSLLVTDENGCRLDTAFTVVSPPALEVELLHLQDASCSQANGEIEIAISGGTPDYQVLWSNGDLGPQASGLAGDSLYTYQLVDGNGCEIFGQYPVRELVPPMANIYSEIGDGDTLYRAQASVSFESRSPQAAFYEWFVNGEQVGVEEVLMYDFMNEGPQEVILKTFDASVGCPAEDTLIFYVVANGKVIIPNAFTPNDDGFNDTFRPFVEGAQTFEMLIFDQWGKVVTRVSRIEQGWDGSTSQGGLAQEGVYAYQLVIRFNDGRTELHGGSITLFR